MRRIVLISCVSRKLDHAAKARELYTSTWFKLAMAYAQTLKPDRVFVLSARHGLLDLEQRVEPYNESLKTFRRDQVLRWASRTIEQLRSKIDLKRDEVIFLAGERYRRFLMPSIKKAKAPLERMAIGKQLQYMKNATQRRK